MEKIIQKRLLNSKMGNCRWSKKVESEVQCQESRSGGAAYLRQIQRQRALLEICTKIGLYFAEQPPMNFAIGRNNMT